MFQSGLILRVAIVIALSTVPAVRASEPNAHYQRGLEAFEAKDYRAARDAFLTVIESDRLISADVLFNLGNTFFRLDQPGEAALWYRRAALLDPTDIAARQNLRLVRRRSGFLEFERGPLDLLAGLMKPAHWRIMLGAGLWLVAVSLAAIVFLLPSSRLRAAWWTGGALGLVAALLAGAVVWHRHAGNGPAARSVVTTRQVAALTAPTETAAVVIDLPPGSEVVRREERDHWVYAELPGARIGWIKKDALQRLWPYSRELIR